MKRKILVLSVLILSVVFALSLTSCIEGVIIPGVNDGSGQGNQNTSYTVSYRFNNETIFTQTVPSDGYLTDEQINEAKALVPVGYEGETFSGFFTDGAKTTPFKFENKITKNTNVYCQLLFEINYHYGDDIMLTQTVDALDGYLNSVQVDIVNALGIAGEKFTGLYTDKVEKTKFDPRAEITSDVDVYCELIYIVDYRFNGTFYLRQRVDSLEGFTAEHIKEKTDLFFNGFRVDYFYADEGMNVEFNFTEPPVANTTIYCGRDLTKAGDNVRWAIRNEGERVILSFTGYGPMYEFYQYDTDVPWINYYTTITDIEIEEGITSIADYAFYEFNQIGAVELPGTIEYIGKNSFFHSSVTDINFPDSLRTIGNNAFNNCTGLVHLDFNPGLQYINEGAFQKCTSIETVVLTDTIMTFGTSAFQECYNLASAYYIGTKEQYDKILILVDNFWITSLAHTYFLSEAEPTEPGPYWYYGEDGDIRQWYYTIWYMKDRNAKVPFTVDYVDAEVGITSANVDYLNGIVYNGYRFAGWQMGGKTYTIKVGTVLSEDIKLVGNRGNLCGDNLKWSFKNGHLTISKIDSSNPDGTMWDFKNLDDAPWHGRAIIDVIIGSGVTHIGSYAFSEILDKTTPYASFSYLDIPDYVTSIHPSAFYGCDHLLYIYYHGSDLDLYGNDTTEPKIKGLKEIDEAFDFRVYTSAVDVDYSTLGEGAYWTYVIGQSYITRRVAWEFSDGVLKVGGGDESHIMINYNSHADTPWYSYRDQVKSVIINDNIHTIGHHSFEGMSSVTSILVPRRIAKTSATAFVGTGYYQTELESRGIVYIYTQEKSDDDTFRYAHLIKVDPAKAGEVFIIPEKTLSIAEQAFEGCTNIKKLVMTKDISPDGIYSTALVGLTALEGIYFEGNADAWSSYKNADTTPAEVYLISASAPAAGDTGKWWHWNEDKSEPIAW